MKNIMIHIGCMLLALAAFAACSPDDFGHLSADGIPSIEDYEVEISVDQELNQVTFTMLNCKGAMPVWYFEGESSPYSTVNGLQKIFSKAGDYTVAVKVMNASGVSDGTIYRTFHIDNTIVDFTKYVTLLTGGESKTWAMAKDEAGHFACGESGSDGTNWWSASPNEKAAYGIYNNKLTFTSDYTYTFDPGSTGTMYVNTGVTGLWPDYEAGEDYQVPVDLTTTPFEFEVDGEDVYIVLPSHTPFLYVPYADSWENPRFKVESISATRLVLISDNGEIAWHYVLEYGTSSTFTGFDPDSDCNMWKDANMTLDHTFYAITSSWADITGSETVTVNGSSVTSTWPSATEQQWQAQVHLTTDLSLNSVESYDFSCIVNSSTDQSGVTVKVTTWDDGAYLFAETFAVEAYTDHVFYLSDIPGVDLSTVKLVLDFGGCPDNTTVTVSSIVLKEHSCDDGTVLPDDSSDDSGEDGVIWADITSADNLWTGANMSLGSTYYAVTNSWSDITGTETVTVNSNYSVTAIWPQATVSQWQAQVHLSTDLSLTSGTNYDFKCTINSSTAQSGITVKLTDSSDDGNYLLLGQGITVEPYTDYEFYLTNLDGIDADNIKLVLDFGGCPDNTEVTVSDIILQEHNAASSGSTANWGATENLWESASLDFNYYYAPGWSQIADPAMTQSGGNYTFSFPSATYAQWQAQVFFITDIATSASNNYDFKVVLNSTQDISGVTVKLYQNGDDNTFYFTENVDLSAYVDYEFTAVDMEGLDISKVNLVLDFGGNPDNTEVTVSDIILQVHE